MKDLTPLGKDQCNLCIHDDIISPTTLTRGDNYTWEILLLLVHILLYFYKASKPTVTVWQCMNKESSHVIFYT